MYIRYICIFYFILLQSAQLLLKAPLLSPFCLVSRQTHNLHWDIFHVWDWGVGFEEAVASQTECQAVFCFFFPVESNPCDVCCLPQAGLGLGLTSKSCYTLSWRRLVMVLFLFKRPELMRKNKNTGDDIEISQMRFICEAFQGNIWVFYLLHLLPSWAVIHYLSRKKTQAHTVKLSAVTKYTNLASW